MRHHLRWSAPRATVVRGDGPIRVSTEEPPEGWEPPPFMGFGYAETEDGED